MKKSPSLCQRCEMPPYAPHSLEARSRNKVGSDNLFLQFLFAQVSVKVKNVKRNLEHRFGWDELPVISSASVHNSAKMGDEIKAICRLPSYFYSAKKHSLLFTKRSSTERDTLAWIWGRWLLLEESQLIFFLQSKR